MPPKGLSGHFRRATAVDEVWVLPKGLYVGRLDGPVGGLFIDAGETEWPLAESNLAGHECDPGLFMRDRLPSLGGVS